MKYLIITIVTVLSSTAFANNLYRTVVVDCVPADAADPMGLDFTLIGSTIPNDESRIAIRSVHKNYGVYFVPVSGSFSVSTFNTEPIIYAGAKDAGQDFRFEVRDVDPQQRKVLARIYSRQFYSMDIRQDVVCRVRE